MTQPANQGGRRAIVLGMLASALWTLSTQIPPLLLLQPTQYGLYSLVYLLYAFATSVMLSAVLEASVRHATLSKTPQDHLRVAEAATHVSILFALLAGAIYGTVRQDLSEGLVAAFAVAAATYRGAARFQDTHAGRHSKSAAIDLATIVIASAIWSCEILWAEMDTLSALFPWAISSGIACLLSTTPRWGAWNSPLSWWRTHSREIKPLLADSLLMDLGALGTPAMLAPILSAHGFGIYRAMSTVAAPMRLILNPLRPVLAHQPTQVLITRRAQSLSFALALACGLTASGALSLIGLRSLPLGSLGALAPYATPVGVYIAANTLGHYWYLVARSHASGSWLMKRRATQTILLTALPIAGALSLGIYGALWFSALGTVASALSWSSVAGNIRNSQAQRNSTTSAQREKGKAK